MAHTLTADLVMRAIKRCRNSQASGPDNFHLEATQNYGNPIDFGNFSCSVLIYICLICIVVCMHNFHSAYIFIVCNMYVIYNLVHVPPLFDNYHIVLNCTTNCVYSPMTHILHTLDFKYILLLLHMVMTTLRYTHNMKPLNFTQEYDTLKL